MVCALCLTYTHKNGVFLGLIFFHSTIMYTNLKQHDANIQTFGQTDRPDSNEYKINRVLNVIVELVVNLQLDIQSRYIYLFFYDRRLKQTNTRWTLNESNRN